MPVALKTWEDSGVRDGSGEGKLGRAVGRVAGDEGREMGLFGQFFLCFLKQQLPEPVWRLTDGSPSGPPTPGLAREQFLPS